MNDIQNIMIALGFFPHAKEIFTYAAGLALKLNADLTVVNVINSRDMAAVSTIANMGYEVDAAHYIENIRQEREKLLDEIVKDSSFPADRVRAIFTVGNPVDELLRVAAEEKVDMIVMGTKGHTDLAHVFVGSVAEKVFRRSPVPVVSFRDEQTARRMRQRLHLE